MLKDAVPVIHLLTEGDNFGYQTSPTNVVPNLW